MSGLRVLSKERDVLETTLKPVQLSLITRSRKSLIVLPTPCRGSAPQTRGSLDQKRGSVISLLVDSPKKNTVDF